MVQEVIFSIFKKVNSLQLCSFLLYNSHHEYLCRSQMSTSYLKILAYIHMMWGLGDSRRACSSFYRKDIFMIQVYSRFQTTQLLSLSHCFDQHSLFVSCSEMNIIDLHTYFQYHTLLMVFILRALNAACHFCQFQIIITK